MILIRTALRVESMLVLKSCNVLQKAQRNLQERKNWKKFCFVLITSIMIQLVALVEFVGHCLRRSIALCGHACLRTSFWYYFYFVFSKQQFRFLKNIFSIRYWYASSTQTTIDATRNQTRRRTISATCQYQRGFYFKYFVFFKKKK